MIGTWLGRYVGEWLGPIDGTVDPPVEPPPQVGHGGYGFLPEKPRRRDTDDDTLMLILL